MAMNARNALKGVFGIAERAYLRFDKRLIRGARNLRLVRDITNRWGGRISYGEWCHVIGVFQTLIFHHLREKTNNHILDVGCGTGFLGIASEPFLGNEGIYLGIDVIRRNIEFCKKHYPRGSHAFHHLDVRNPTYAPEQKAGKENWPVADESMDMVTALSVWTHLNEEDATFYFREVGRVLKSGGRSILTFFLLDDHYYAGLENRSDAPGRYHTSSQDRWIFDTPCSQSGHWFHRRLVEQPEDAIGVTPAGTDMMLEGTDLALTTTYIGNWKEVPGVFFQDVLVFEKA
jgi:SAM-dependent methyltransferase